MNRVLRTIFIAYLLFSSFSIVAQGWKPANTPPGITEIRDMITFEGNLFIGVDGVVYRSEDHGVSWDYVQIPYSMYYCFFAVQHDELFIISQKYVARSADGFNWDVETVVTPDVHILDVTSDGEKLWAATIIGLYSSTDGVTWNKAEDFPLEAFSSITAQGSQLFASSIYQPKKIMFSTDGGLNWDSRTSDILFISRVDYNNGILLSQAGDGTWRSTDAGVTWQKVHEKGIVFRSGSTYYHIGSASVSTSTNNGLTWSQKASTLPPYAAQFGAVLDGQLFSGANGGGIHTTSVSDPATWVQVNGELHHLQILDFEYHQDALFMTATSRGVVASDDEGQTWTQCADATLLADASIKRLQSIGDDLFACNSYNIFRTSDKGLSWVDLGRVVPGGLVTDIAAFKSKIVAAGTNGVYLWNEAGSNWIKMPGVSNTAEWISSSNDMLYCGNAQGLHRYNEATQTWVPVSVNGSNPYVYELVFIGYEIFIQLQNELLQSGDGGQTWKTVDDGNPSLEMSSRHTALYRNVDNQFSQSLDSGATWQAIAGSDRGPALRFGFSAKHVFVDFNDRVWYRPVEEFAPPFAAADTAFSADEPLIIRFDHKPYTTSGDALEEDDLDALISIVDSGGNEVPFEAALSADHLAITIVITDPEPGEVYTITVAPVQNASGVESTSQTLTVRSADEAVLGIGENENAKVKVYPNPFHHQLTISFTDGNGRLKSVTIFDNTGKPVHTINANEKLLSVDDLDLKPGIYFIRLVAGNRTYMRKVMKR